MGRGSWIRRLVVGLVTLVLVAGCSPGATTTPGASPSAVPSVVAATPTTSPISTQPNPSPSSGPPAPASTTTTTPSASLGSYLPLFPFATVQEVHAWQQSYVSGGHQPWHLDAGETALAFAAWLGYTGEITGIDQVIELRTDGAGAHVSVGFYVGGSNIENAHTSAIVHLVHWGTGSYVPWEVVGTEDTTFSLTGPVYGATVTSPLTVGGLINGVDENIRVQVRTASSSSAVGTFCCVPAGDTNTPWSATVSFTASSGAVLTIAAQTGGHVTAVERFTVSGVRVR